MSKTCNITTDSQLSSKRLFMTIANLAERCFQMHENHFKSLSEEHGSYNILAISVA